MSYTSAIVLLWSLYLIALSIMIIWQKRAPIATLSWILSLAALPYIGLIIYYVFGPQKIKRRRMRRVASKLRLTGGLAAAAANDITPPVTAVQMAKLGTATSYLPPASCSRLEILVDGGAAFSAIFTAIEQAEHSVHLEYYIYEPDHIGLALARLLARKAQEGVKVRLLIDALGSKRLGKKFLGPMLNAGVVIAFFHHTTFRKFRPVINMRTHRKIVVCDDRIGFTGGINITDEEDERINPHAYHDLHLLLEGQAVERLQQVFWEDWFYTTGEQRQAAQTLTATPGDQIVQVLQSGPDNELAPIYRTYLATINAAQERVWLTTPYFVPDEAAMTALTSAALRGVDVRVMVPRKSDSRLVTLAARSYFEELTQAGVQVWEYTTRMLHSKTLVVDRSYAMIGTANFDNRSFRLNFEVSVLGYGEYLADRLAIEFEKDLEHCVRVGRPRKISKLEAFGEACARLCSPLL
ncbi:cardiolipin synthase [Amantichitinum ursilacus]|nr:cardiolipin synthase [Amantichitinum ursilacus]